MKIEVWSDVMCPFCYIGKRTLGMALDEFEHKDEIEVSFRSYQLDPDAKKNPGVDIHEIMSKKIRGSYEQARQMNAQVAEHAKSIGLNYDFDNLIPTNTYDALRLSYFAKEHGKMGEMIERMMSAYLVEAKDVGDHNVLADLAQEVGLNRDDALKILAGNDYAEQIEKDKKDGQRLGIQGVPFFVINDKYAISGAQPLTAFKDNIQKAWSEFEVEKKAATDAYCADGVCSIN